MIRSGQPHQQHPADTDDNQDAAAAAADDDADDELRHVGESFALLLQLLRLCTNWNELVSSDTALDDALARLTEHEFTGGTMGFGVHTERTIEQLASILTVTDGKCDTVHTVIDSSSQSADSDSRITDILVERVDTGTDSCELADSGTVTCKTTDTISDGYESADTITVSCESADTVVDTDSRYKTTDTVIDSNCQSANMGGDAGADSCESADRVTVGCKTVADIDLGTDTDSCELGDAGSVSCKTTDTIDDSCEHDDTITVSCRTIVVMSIDTATDTDVDDRSKTLSQDVQATSLASEQIMPTLGVSESTQMSVNMDSDDDVNDRLIYPDTTSMPVNRKVIEQDIADTSVLGRDQQQQQQQQLHQQQRHMSASPSVDVSRGSTHVSEELPATVPDSARHRSMADEDISSSTQPSQQDLDELSREELISAQDQSTDVPSRPAAKTEYRDNVRVTDSLKSKSSIVRDSCISCQQPMSLVARDCCDSSPQKQSLSHELERRSSGHVCKYDPTWLFRNSFGRRLSKCYHVAKPDRNL